jgi:hypothetical protein
LRRWGDAVAQSAAYLFPTRPAVRMQIEKPEEEDQLPRPIGENVPGGVLVHYWLKEKPKEKEVVKIEVLAGDQLLRSVSSEKKEHPGDLKEQAEQAELEKDKDKPLEPKAGVNRYLWDMRTLRPTLVPKAVFNEGEKAPPKVGPGKYTVRLTVGDRSWTEAIEVRPHPAGYATAEDLKAQYDLLAAIRDRISETHAAVMRIRDARAQAKDLGERAEKLGKGKDLSTRAKTIGEKLTAVEEKLINPQIRADEDDLNYEPKLDHDFAYLAGIVASADAKPTAASKRYYEELKGRLGSVLAELSTVMDRDVADFNKAVAAAQIPPVAPVVRTGS